MTRQETWNGLREFLGDFHYFELLTTLNAVDVKIFGEGDRVIADDRQVEAGYFHDRLGLDAALRVEITTGASETVKFLTSDGHAGTRRAFVYQAQARTLTLPGSATVGVAEGVVLAAGSRSLVVFQADPGNAGTIALGPAGLTTNTSPILLGPGDMWREEIAASAAWSGIASVAAQTLRLMTAA